MAKTATALKSPAGATKHATKALVTKALAGRDFTISLKGIPWVDAQTKSRLEVAARSPSGKRQNDPQLVVE